MVRPGRKMKLGRTVAIGEAVGIVEDIDGEGYRLIPVSYTHLDVYKRQDFFRHRP